MDLNYTIMVYKLGCVVKQKGRKKACKMDRRAYMIDGSGMLRVFVFIRDHSSRPVKRLG